ncbi:MAG: 50S ribosomal protein L34e [Candidatus Aenigmarchaeota archaeon]|nr:50S ribosomal protein L34e [Candidatus Aenigmarchaeota archaeon]
MKKVKRRVTSGKVRIHVKREKTALHRCANCKGILHGMKRLMQSRVRKLAKSDRRPDRPYGGYLCSNCTRELFRERARVSNDI